MKNILGIILLLLNKRIYPLNLKNHLYLPNQSNEINKKSTKYTIILSGILLIASTLRSQSRDSTILFCPSFESEVVFVTSDALQQVYIAGQLLFEYNNRRLGQVGIIDANNPFNVLVYYPELATIIVLDRTFSEIKSINLFNLNIFEPQAVALSNDNNIWVYDPINFQLKKISKEGALLFQSKPLHQATQVVLQPTFLIERNNQVFISDTLHGIFVFDSFGQWSQHIPITNIHQLQVVKDQLVYIKEGNLYEYSLNTHSASVFCELPKGATAAILLSDQILIAIGKNILTRNGKSVNEE